MKNEKSIGKTIAALLLFIVIMMPTCVHFFHIFEGHDHVVCTEQATHIHESNVECEICSFHFTSINYDIAKYPDLELPEITVRITANFESLHLLSLKTTNTRLRAPPIYS